MTDYVKVGKFLSCVLRHKPDMIGLELDLGGWANIEELISKSKKIKLTREIIDKVVETNNKKRYKISDDGQRIRASQGHSIPVDLGLEPKEPPELLYHGTADRNLDMVKKEGLKRMNRQYLHLSIDEETAIQVGQRHGKPVVIPIKARDMYLEGFLFYLSDNNVWLTNYVPPEFMGDVL